MTEPEKVRTFTDMVPLVRPNCETVQGLRRWAESRGTVQPLPIFSPDEYVALERREKRLYDLRREVVNANLGILQTPMLVKVRETMDDRIWANAINNSPGAREGIMINGGGAQGKTETVLAVVADFLTEWEDVHDLKNPTAFPGGRDAHEPVVYARVPSKPTPKTLCVAVLEAVGEDADERRDTFGTLRRRAIKSLKELGTRVLVLDDITRIKMHRLDDQDVLDLIRDLMDTGATLILVGVGIPSSGLLSEGTTDAPQRDPQASSSQRRGPVRPALNDAEVGLSTGARLLRKRKVEDDDQYTQTERRFKLLHMGNFAFDTPEQKRDWVSFLAGMGAHVRLVGMDKANPGRILTDGEMPEYLFRRTGGVVGTLCRLLDEACRAAIKNPDPETGVESFTYDLLDGLEANYSAEEGRVAEAGEIPFVPPAPAARKAASKPARGASTVLRERRPSRAETAVAESG